MKLKEIFPQIETNQTFQNICRDSQFAKPGDIYFCLSKNKEKALSRCQQAKDNGAIVVSELDFDIKVDDARDAFACACKKFYDNACDDLKIIGITGTNGKTTTSRVIAEMLKRNQKKVGVIGTSGVFFDGKKFESPLTTPDADFLHKTFFEMRNAGVEEVVMEVYAHSIDQKRINGINLDIGVLTNITQDHLDYFETFENFEKTKLVFFKKDHIKLAVVCADDSSAKKLIDTAKIPVLTYAINSPSDTFAIDID